MTKEEKVIFDRVREDLVGNFGITIDFNSLQNIIATAIAKEACRLAITTMSNDNDIIEKINRIILNINEIEKRISALENKRPEYVSPSVYGPIRYQCPTCGVIVEGSESHLCYGVYERADK